MSGINEIKKKAKLSMDEMYDNQPVGKLEKQKTKKPKTQQTNQPTVQLEIKPDLQSPGNPSSQETNQHIGHKAGHPTNQPHGNLETHLDIKQDYQAPKQTSIFPTTKQQTLKIPTYKMTFNLTEDIYKAFNDLYANRMLRGRKTEKSEMICEAIQWLIKMEQ